MAGIKEGFLGRTVWEGHKTFVLAWPGTGTQQTQALTAVWAYLSWSKVLWFLFFSVFANASIHMHMHVTFLLGEELCKF